jgi:hypothetical protein
MRPQPLDGERGLGLGAVAGEPLADQAELERGHVVAAAEHAAEQAVLGQRADERAVQAARRRAVAGDRRQHVAGQRLRAAQQRHVLVGQVRVRRRGVAAHGITAVATSSTRAASSNSAVTPNRPIAG